MTPLKLGTSPEGQPTDHSASTTSMPSTHSPSGGGGLPFARSPDSPPDAADAIRPHLPTRRSSSGSLTKQQLDLRASQIILNALERTTSASQQSSISTEPSSSRTSGSFSKMSFSSMMGGLSALSLTRGGSEDKERGRSSQKEKNKQRSSSVSARDSQDESESRTVDRTRSMSPFRRRNSRMRDPSPSVEALRLSQSDVESDSEGVAPRRSIRPRNAFSQSATSDDESADEGDSDESEESWSENDEFDSITEQNTERNALIPAETLEDGIEAPDPLGEGVNIIVPPEPYFPSTLNARNPRRKKSLKHEPQPIRTSRPIFQRDRCTITLTQGEPRHALEVSNRRSRRYVVASDLSEESRYAVEWGVGTVLRDGDEM